MFPFLTHCIFIRIELVAVLSMPGSVNEGWFSFIIECLVLYLHVTVTFVGFAVTRQVNVTVWPTDAATFSIDDIKQTGRSKMPHKKNQIVKIISMIKEYPIFLLGNESIRITTRKLQQILRSMLTKIGAGCKWVKWDCVESQPSFVYNSK